MQHKKIIFQDQSQIGRQKAKNLQLVINERLMRDENISLPSEMEEFACLSEISSSLFVNYFEKTIAQISSVYLTSYFPSGCGMLHPAISYSLQDNAIANALVYNIAMKHYFLLINLEGRFFILDYTVDQFFGVNDPAGSVAPFFYPVADVVQDYYLRSIYLGELNYFKSFNPFLKNQQILRQKLNQIIKGEPA